MGAEKKKVLRDFSEWFHQTLDRAEIVDYRFPVKGCGVWLDDGELDKAFAYLNEKAKPGQAKAKPEGIIGKVHALRDSGVRR